LFYIEITVFILHVFFLHTLYIAVYAIVMELVLTVSIYTWEYFVLYSYEYCPMYTANNVLSCNVVT